VRRIGTGAGDCHGIAIRVIDRRILARRPVLHEFVRVGDVELVAVVVVETTGFEYVMDDGEIAAEHAGRDRAVVVADPVAFAPLVIELDLQRADERIRERPG
jgi:hypothetical protein